MYNGLLDSLQRIAAANRQRSQTIQLDRETEKYHATKGSIERTCVAFR